MIEAIEVLHKEDIAHRDLKPENIMLDSLLNLKLIDFGLSNQVEGGQIRELSTFAGTPQFQAPEIFEKKKYDGKRADMFSLGVILFMVVNKSYPFSVADKNDKYYCYIFKNTKQSYTQYWKLMNMRFKKKGIDLTKQSEEFRKLIFKLLCYNPKQRITIEELKNDPWLNMEGYSNTKTRK